MLLAILAACAAPPAAPIESTQPATEAPVPAAEQTARAAQPEVEAAGGTPPGYPTEVIEQVVNDPLVVALLAGLEQRGLAVALSDASRNEMLRDAPGQGYRLGEGWLHLHVYSDVAAAEAAAARIPAEMEASIADWVGPPHFFQCDRLIAAYFGADPAALNALGELCAPPFYTTPLPDEGNNAPITDYGHVVTVDLGRQLVPEDLWPTGLNGGEYAALGMDSELYVVEWASATATRVTDDGLGKVEAVLSGRFIAWMAQTGQEAQGMPLVHLYVLDRQTGEQRVITQQPAPRAQLVLDGDRLAWADKRNEVDGHYAAYDIYAYDLATNTEIAVAVAPGAQNQPSLSGDLLVWADNRDSAHRDDNLAGCGNCPANRFDLYLYNFTTQTTQVLVSGEALRSEPSIAGRRVAWIEFGEVETTFDSGLAIGRADVFWLDLDTRTLHRATATRQSESGTVLDGDRLLWTVRKDCDVLEVVVGATPEPPHTGVYVQDLSSGAVRRLTDYVEPRALMEGGAVMIVEGCMAGRSVYVVAVD